MTEALSAALIARMQGEYGQQALSNFALDILLDIANAEIARLQMDVTHKEGLNAALSERVREALEQIEQMKQANDPKRAAVMGAADKVKKLQADTNGTNSHTK